MGKNSKKRKHRELTQEEIWDDSALIRSWDEALEEYKLYHSIHAKGENVEDVLRQAEADNEEFNEEETVSQTSGANITNGAMIDTAMLEELGDGISHGGEVQNNQPELEEGELHSADGEYRPIEEGTTLPRNIHKAKSSSSAQPQPETQKGHGAHGNSQGLSSMPHDVIGGVQDEGLKNLMMAWYHAGYYTGLYEGQQQSNQPGAQ